MQGLKKSRKLAKGEVDLRVGNGARVAALAVGAYSFFTQWINYRSKILLFCSSINEKYNIYFLFGFRRFYDYYKE